MPLVQFCLFYFLCRTFLKLGKCNRKMHFYQNLICIFFYSLKLFLHKQTIKFSKTIFSFLPKHSFKPIITTSISMNPHSKPLITDTIFQGGEPFTTIAVGSDRDTGYTREIKPKGEFTQRQEEVIQIKLCNQNKVTS